MDKFPVGLRVLVVDDDPTCLMILEKMLKSCLYEVTKRSRAEDALSLLRENKNGYDIVISDVHMPDMDGFKLLEQIGLEMDLPVIMMSADDSKHVVMKGVTHGACDYLIKPVRIEALKNIWQHVVRRRRNEWKDFEQSGSMEEGEKQLKHSEDAEYSSSANEGNWINSKKRKDEEEELEERDDSSTLKKPRVVWSVELHQQFVAAVNQLGIEKAVPKKILELMNVPGLTRENVASHLQKYRLYLRRLSGASQHQNNLGNSFVIPQEALYGSLASLSGFDLQAPAASGQLPAHSLAALQAAGLGRTTAKSRIPGPILDKRNIFSFENPKVNAQQHLSTSKQINLLHGIPTALEPKQLANLSHSAQSQGGMMSKPPSMEHMFSESSGSHVHRLPNSMGQPIISTLVTDGMVPRNGLAENGRGTGYSPVSQTSTLNFQFNDSLELPSSCFPLGSTPAVSSLASKGAFQEEFSSNIRGPISFRPSYNIFGEMHQQKPHNLELQHAGLNFNSSLQSSTLQENIGSRPSFVGHEGYPSRETDGRDRNTTGVTMRPMLLAEDASPFENLHTEGHLTNNLSENSVKIKAESYVFPEQFNQEDLMSSLLKQQQGGIGLTDNEFDFDGYHLDNIPV